MPGGTRILLDGAHARNLLARGQWQGAGATRVSKGNNERNPEWQRGDPIGVVIPRTLRIATFVKVPSKHAAVAKIGVLTNHIY